MFKAKDYMLICILCKLCITYISLNISTDTVKNVGVVLDQDLTTNLTTNLN